jgi:hypothetical protein
MSYGERETRARALMKTKGIKSVRTVNLPDSDYAHVYVTRDQRKRAGTKAKKKKGTR